MILANELRKGTVFKFKNELHLVLEYQHHKPGKGGAIVRVKLKNLIKGSIFDFTFNPEDRLEDVQLTRRKAEYLYNDGEYFHFMDTESYEQFQVEKEKLEKESKYLLEGMQVDIDFLENEPLFVHPPMFVELEVTETQPGVKGDTVSGGTKPAILETGLKINVPLFVNSGDIVKVDTRTDTYVERVKKS
jgi:elongation factor P